MFLGEYQHALDAKGRIILPSKFRGRLEDGCVLTKARDGCLAVYPREEWEQVAASLGERRLGTQEGRDVARLMFSGAHEDRPDGQGRVTIPEHLRRYAGLEHDVAVIGVGPHLELWDRARWDRHREEKERQILAEPTPDLPF